MAQFEEAEGKILNKPLDTVRNLWAQLQIDPSSETLYDQVALEIYSKTRAAMNLFNTQKRPKSNKQAANAPDENQENEDEPMKDEQVQPEPQAKKKDTEKRAAHPASGENNVRE